jgi:C4-dicarboxylate transporter DctM subunit
MARATWSEAGSVAIAAAPAAVVPVIIVGGILGGVFTPTEAGGVAALYALIYGIIRGRHDARGLYGLFLSAAVTTASALITLAGAALFSYVLIAGGFAEASLNALLALTDNSTAAMLLLVAGLFILSLAVEPVPALIMAIPVLMPAVQHFGLN